MTKAKLMWNYVKLMLAHPPYEPLEEPLADRHLHHGSRRHVPRRALDGPPHLEGAHALVHARPHLLHRVVGRHGRRAGREEISRVGAELGPLVRHQTLPRQRGHRRPLRLRRRGALLALELLDKRGDELEQGRAGWPAGLWHACRPWARRAGGRGQRSVQEALGLVQRS